MEVNWSNREFVLREVSKDGTALRYASEELRADRDIVLQAINSNPAALIYASEELKNDDELLIISAKKYGEYIENDEDDLYYYWDEIVPEELLSKESFLKTFTDYNFDVSQLEGRIPKDLTSDKDFMTKMIKKYYGFIFEASSKLKSDKEMWDTIDETYAGFEEPEIARDEMLEKFDKLEKEGMDIPYNKIAKQALMNWNGLSEQDANEMITNSSFEEIESQVYAKSSIDYAIDELTDNFHLTDKEGLEDYVFSGTPVYIDKIEKYMFSKNKNDGKINYDNIIQVLSAVHDGWVKDNQKKFMAREKKHQHMPIELIGWKEAKADLLFVKPILESMNIQIDETELENAYNDRVKKFFLDKGIISKESLVNLISKGEQFYPALSGQEDILEAFKDKEFIRKSVIPQIEENGIGNIDERGKEVADELLQDFSEESLAKLSKEDRDELESRLDKENEQLETEKETLTEKEESIRRIKEKMQKHKELQAEIAQIKRNQKANEEYGG